MDLAIRPEKTRAVIFTWPDGSVTWEASAWLRLFPPENVHQVRMRDVVVARNWAMRELCVKAPPEVEHFVWMDRDMRPGPAALPVLAAEADLVGCLYPLSKMAAWSDPQAVHLGLVRFNRRVVETVRPPWFQFTYSEDGAALRQCECEHFVTKVKAAGLAVARAGWSEHDTKGVSHGAH